jgi:arsenite methyltransferase
MVEQHETHELVQKAYGELAKRQSTCCGPAAQAPLSGVASCCCGPVGATALTNPLPEADLGLSCGDPLTFAEVREGDTVLDLGSGAGRDAFMAALLAGPQGSVIGVDMTPEMLALARSNARKLADAKGLVNVEFREGYIEALPVDDASVDLVISNCVINLSTDKPQVFREAFRVLKSGGRMVVSDIVLNRPLPEELRSNIALYAGCVAGALLRDDYFGAMLAAGFGSLEVLSERQHRASDAAGDPISESINESLHGSVELLDGVASSVTVRAVK